jgi:MFS transporter, DHA1 family, multidrug resistance protein
MLRMKKNLKPAILSAMVLALASFGDAFLYAVLPLNSVQMGVPIVWVGFLLSINRFIRLIANQVFSWLFNTFGFKRITILAAILAAVSTACYGMASGLLIFISARILWGLCYSSLRISCISYSIDSSSQGFSLGLNRGLQETGPILALLVGPLLLQYVSVPATFIIFSVLSSLAIIVAYYLPELPERNETFNFTFNPVPSSFNFIVFISAFIVEGILNVLMGRLFMTGTISRVEITAVTAFYLGYRRFSNVLVSPIAGRLADKSGIEKVFMYASLLTVVSLVIIATGYIQVGLVATFTFQSVSSALAPVAITWKEENRLKAISSNTTWKDLGSATGALIGGALLKISSIEPYLLVLIFILLFAIINHAYKRDLLKFI